MTTIRMSHPNPLPIDEAKRRLAEAARMYCSIYGVSQRWDGDTLVLSGALASGQARFSADKVDVELTLGPGASSDKDRRDVEWGLQEAFSRCLRA